MPNNSDNPRNESEETGSAKNRSVSPLISLPKGGGAIRGIGEKFAANPVTGTGSLSVPIFVSPGRSGFGPQLSLSYDSGSGNGPFGFGWSLSLPSITRKTDKGLPRYHDLDGSDDFILSGAEDLVPFLVNQNNYWKEETFESEGGAFKIQRYRPRIEGLFTRIERWTDKKTGELFWRSISKDNVITVYGKNKNSRICDPQDDLRIFGWLICESYDDRGNAIYYEYAEENSLGVDASSANEKNRCDYTANRYLKFIRYGNQAPYEGSEDLSKRDDWMFEVVFDYGEHDSYNPTTKEVRPWKAREDPFSTYRSGFEVRTYRFCQRVLMFHHFLDELAVRDYLVRSTDFTYFESPIASYITKIIQSGYVRSSDGTFLKRSLPPLEFNYSEAKISDKIEKIDVASLENLPCGLDNTRYLWVDLDGEGLSGILTEQAGSWFYKPNLGEGRFGPLETISSKPSLTALNSGRQQLMDLAGDGRLDLVELSGPVSGFYERTHDKGWKQFISFISQPNLEWNDPHLKLIDLTGDGHVDVLITKDDVLVWYPSLAEQGFGSCSLVRKPHDEEKGPRLIFADGAQSICLADMSGDGLTDLVRISNGGVCYWPNLGYGRFGQKVTMDNSPWFDHPELFDHQRIRLADIDGSGVTDIIYLGRDGVHIYLNQSGNSWSDPQILKQFPPVDNLATVVVVDLFGNGTACIVWSSPLPGNAGRQMRYIDLMGGQKPHLLIKSINNLGSETCVRYAPSTKFYLADKLARKPWITKIPFSVHVVERVETYDRISCNRFVTRYAYHHGYFDGIEREFRGFGMVEQWDTEDFAVLCASDAFPIGDNIDVASHVPPVYTRTWFHTGVHLGRGRVSDFFAGLLDERDRGEYYREPAWRDDDAQAKKRLLDDTVLPDGLTIEEEREACRTLKGSMLRQEVYSLDGTTKEQHPYTVTEQNFTIRCLQPQAGNRHAVFFSHAREAISYHYERNPTDPRITHTLTLEVDDFGNILRSITVGYPRSNVPERQPEQNETHLTLTLNRFANCDDQQGWRRIGLPVEARTYEVVKPPATALRYAWEELHSLVGALVPLNEDEPLQAKTLAYEQWDWRKHWNSQTEPGGLVNSRLRLIEHVRTLYRPDDLGISKDNPLALLPLGTVESLALPGESYKLALTTVLVAGVFGGRVTDAMLEAESRYVHSEGDRNWWIPSGQMFYSPGSTDTSEQELAYARQHFFLPQRYRDPFHTNAVSTETFVSYDAYDLLVQETRDALGNRVTVGECDAAGNLIKSGNDYRVLQPCLVTDPNRNRTAVAFDALGMVVGTAAMGKQCEKAGDSLEGFEADLDDNTKEEHLNSPLTDPGEILQRATTRLVYDLWAYFKTRENSQPQPPVVYTLAREVHDADLLFDGMSKVQHSFSYSDGFGREIQKKVQAEPGEVEGAAVASRWVGSGWTIYNNKGKPIKKFEPFFSATHGYEFAKALGVSSTLFYDPVGRVVATLHPNHSYEKAVFNPWQQESWDVNDTVAEADPRHDKDVGSYFQRLAEKDFLPTWHAGRKDGRMGQEEQASARKAEAHNGTPAVTYFDSLARGFLTIADNGPCGKYATRIEQDIEGNQRVVIDALGRVVMRYEYDMLGSRIKQESMDAGARWILNDVAGKAVYGWDDRGHRLRHVYDRMQRPTHLYVSHENEPEKLAERTVYGEAHPDSRSWDSGLPGGGKLNLRTKAFLLMDGAGLVVNRGSNPGTKEEEAYDFKGNLLRSRRQMALDYEKSPDWSGIEPLLSATEIDMSAIEAALEPLLEEETFAGSSIFDALNRPVEVTSPDGSVHRPIFNEANLLERMEVNLHGSNAATAFVENIDYNARGQRELIEYGNGVQTCYYYDELTFRLTHLCTKRGEKKLQDLFYAYDPVGNITSIRDDSLQTIYFQGEVVKPASDYIYDAIYRLTNAHGREHIGQASGAHTWNDSSRAGLAHPNDGQKMHNYSESYQYDEAGNFLQMSHYARQGDWVRKFAYDETSPIEPGRANNRLSLTEVGGGRERYGYDAHGNMTSMPHLNTMEWDFKDQMQMVDLGNGGKAYYVYDAAGQRARKVHQHGGDLQEERIYLGGFEVYRKRSSTGLKLERETLHIMDDKQRIALVETRTEGEDESLPLLVRYQLGNHLGSCCLELDETAQIISYEEYYPYGSTSYQAARSRVETPKRYRYTGKERDEESGLYYHGARYYAPWLGRWTSCDPAWLVDGPNLYAFVRANPINFQDDVGTNGKRIVVNINLANLQTENINLTMIRNISPSQQTQQQNQQTQQQPPQNISVNQNLPYIQQTQQQSQPPQNINVNQNPPHSQQTQQQSQPRQNISIKQNPPHSQQTQQQPLRNISMNQNPPHSQQTQQQPQPRQNISIKQNLPHSQQTQQQPRLNINTNQNPPQSQLTPQQTNQDRAISKTMIPSSPHSFRMENYSFNYLVFKPFHIPEIIGLIAAIIFILIARSPSMKWNEQIKLMIETISSAQSVSREADQALDPLGYTDEQGFWIIDTGVH